MGAEGVLFLPLLFLKYFQGFILLFQINISLLW